MFKKNIFENTKFNFAKHSKFVTLGICAFLFVAIIIFSFFSINKNIEFKGGHIVTITLGEEIKSDSTFKKHTNFLKRILKQNNLKFYSVQRQGADSEMAIVLKYSGQFNDDKIEQIDNSIKTEFSIDDSLISQHEVIAPLITQNLTLWTIISVLLLISIFSVYALFRFNVAGAIAGVAAMFAGVLSFAGLVSVTRVPVGFAFFAMLPLVAIVMIYLSNCMLETIRADLEIFEGKINKNQIVNSAIKTQLGRMIVMFAFMLLLAVVFMVWPSVNLTFVGLQLAFCVIAISAGLMFVFPYIWINLIEHIKIKKKITIKPEADTTEK